MPLNKQSGNMYSWIDFTWNPIRGKCPHDCIYCLTAGTKILMEDYSTKNIEDIKIGEGVIGLKQDNNGRGFSKFTVAYVKNVSSRVAKTIAIKTEHNGLRLTQEHPLMGSTEKRGCSDWKAAKSYSPYQHLRYIGLPESQTPQGKIGWLSGFCDSDGCFFNSHGQEGFEAVCTNKRLLEAFISTCKEFGLNLRKAWKCSSKKSFNRGNKNPMVTTRIRITTQELKKLIQFPENPSIEFMSGYMAGMLDTDGSVSGKSIRISQSKIANKNKYERIKKCCQELGLEYREEKHGIRILTSLKKRLNFLFNFGTQHSIKRDRLIIGSSIKGSYHSQILSVSRGDMEPVYNLETTCGNFIANGFIVHNCYMKGMAIGDLRFVEKEMDTQLGIGKKIFIGSSTDMFANDVPMEWITEVLKKCRKNPNNQYFFQTKNPIRLLSFPFAFPQDDLMVGVTIESNRDYKYSKAPKIEDRIYGLKELSKYFFPIMISIEPILDFDLIQFIGILDAIRPVFVSIGADSKDHNLLEPPPDKLRAFIKYLGFLELKLKNNLKRILDKKLDESIREVDGDPVFVRKLKL